ncbi:MAG: four helix bundle protein [Verrucomicrobiota bacterium]
MQNAKQDLRERTKAFALRIIKLSASINKHSEEARIISRQLLKSGTSIGANYAEATRARSKAEFISILGISLREAEESLYWIELLESANIVTGKSIEPLKAETRELIAILVTSINTTKKPSR